MKLETYTQPYPCGYTHVVHTKTAKIFIHQDGGFTVVDSNGEVILNR